MNCPRCRRPLFSEREKKEGLCWGCRGHEQKFEDTKNFYKSMIEKLKGWIDS